MSAHRSYGVSVTQKSWTEVCLVLLAFALVLGVIGLAAFDGNFVGGTEAIAKEVDSTTIRADASTSPP